MTHPASASHRHRWQRRGVDRRLRRRDGAAIARLHELLVRASRFEVSRRRAGLPFVRGEELDDLATQAADDALVAVLAELEILCDECFEQLDVYVEAELGHADADATVPGMRAHLQGCPGCSQEYESLRALVQQEAGPAERR